MSDTLLHQVQEPVSVNSSGLELAALALVRRVPGLDGLEISRRLRKAIRGSTWTVAGYGASQLTKLASTLLLARMVAPQAFGLVALVTVFLSGLELFSDLGIGMDVVHSDRGDDPIFINTAFIIQVGRGLILWALASALAYPFAVFYKQPAVLALALVGALSTLFRGFSSGWIWTLTRHVRMKELTILNTSSDAFGLVVSVIWAFVSPTAWALVVGRVAASVALTVASHVASKSPVSLKWDRNAARTILAFGAGMLLSSSTYFLAGEAERLVIGKFVNLIELGCFTLALSISSAASRGFQQIMSQVFFPMMSESIRENRYAAFRHYRKTLRLVLVVSACMASGFILFGQSIVHVLLGHKYEAAGWMLQLLGTRAALDLFVSVGAMMLFATGTSRFAAIANVSKLLFLSAGLFIAFGWFGFHGAMWVLTLAPLANYAVVLVGLRRRCAAVLSTELSTFVTLAVIIVSAMALSGMLGPGVKI